MKTIIYAPADLKDLTHLDKHWESLPSDWKIVFLSRSEHYIEVSAVTNRDVIPLDPEDLPLAGLFVAGSKRGFRCLFGSFGRPAGHLQKLVAAWEETAAKVATAKDRTFPLVPGCWGAMSDFLAVSARAASVRVREWMRCTRRPRDWSTFEADVLRDVVWPRMRAWGCCVVDLPMEQKTQDTVPVGEPAAVPSEAAPELETNNDSESNEDHYSI